MMWRRLSSKRIVPFLALASFAILLYIFVDLHASKKSWRELPQAVGLGEHVQDATPSTAAGDRTNNGFNPRPVFQPGVPKPPGSNYSRILVTPCTSQESVDWIAEELPDLQTAIYRVDDPTAPLHPPRNKGHEVMVYLSYIIDHYHDLPDIILFMHSHRFAWHNEELLETDAVQMLERLSSERITREGFMNLRCTWAPGCPDWMHPGAVEGDASKQEEVMIAQSWGEIFPLDPIPDVLAQPCCAQFAASRERVLSVPKQRYVHYRDWLLRTELSDYISGRVWEYLWHVVFTGENVHCPTPNECYCDGYGICFGGEDETDAFLGLRYRVEDFQNELNSWRDKAGELEAATAEGRMDEAAQLEVPEVGRDQWLEEQIWDTSNQIQTLLWDAMERGENPEERAKAANRPWKPGDGF